MLASIKFKISLLILVNIISSVLSVQRYGSPEDTLYVAEEQSSQKITVINRFNEEKDSKFLERTKRDVTTLPPSTIDDTSVEKHPNIWVTIISLLIQYLPFVLIYLSYIARVM